MKHFISTEALSKKDLEEIFNLADSIKKDPMAFSQKLSGKVIAVLFFEPSTRTRLSFESSIMRLGAGKISAENAKENSSGIKGETLEDTIRTVAGYADAIVMRHSENNSAQRAAGLSVVPIINAGSGSADHPTQAVLDLYTIRELSGKIDDTKIAVMGDLKYGRTANSIIRLLSLYKNIHVYGLAPFGLEMQDDCIQFLKKRGVSYTACSNFNEIPKDCDVIYQTRIQKERFKDASENYSDFVINKATLNKFSKNTLLMHPLPRNGEILTEVDSDPRAVYFKQAHNGIPARMAILLKVLEVL